MRCLFLGTLLVTTGCTGKGVPYDSGAIGDGNPSNNPTSDDTAAGDPGDSINATMMIRNAMDGTGLEGIAVEAQSGDTALTAADGSATLPINAGGTFQFRVVDDGALEHLVFGPTGEEDFIYMTFLATEAMLQQVNTTLGTISTPETGMIVVGIDYDDLSPAAGATASIGSSHDLSWVFGSSGPAFGNTIPSTGGLGVVVFPNVPPGQAGVTITPPPGATCSAFPGGGQMPKAPVLMNHITVVTFHCR